MNFKLFMVLVLFHQTHAKWEGSCDIRDTVNISDGVDLSGTYAWNGIVFTSGTYGESSSDALGNNVEKHARGCICKFKSCIQSCDKNYLNFFTLNTPTGNIDINLTNYAVLTEKSCNEGFQLVPNEYENDHWELLKNGSFIYEDSVVGFNEYCFQFGDHNVTVLMCFGDDSGDSSNAWNIVGKK